MYALNVWWIAYLVHLISHYSYISLLAAAVSPLAQQNREWIRVRGCIQQEGADIEASIYLCLMTIKMGYTIYIVFHLTVTKLRQFQNVNPCASSEMAHARTCSTKSAWTFCACVFTSVLGEERREIEYIMYHEYGVLSVLYQATDISLHFPLIRDIN